MKETRVAACQAHTSDRRHRLPAAQFQTDESRESTCACFFLAYQGWHWRFRITRSQTFAALPK